MTVTCPAPGVYTPSPTFFYAGENGRPAVDIDTQIKHTVFLADNGIRGAVLLGSTGEMIHMTRKERLDFVAAVKKGVEAHGHQDFAILAGVAHNGIEDTLEEVKGLKEAGATVAMVLAPNYFAGSTTQEGVLSWFRNVADESVLPIVIYYYPGVSNNLKIEPATLAALSAHPNIVGVKMSHGDVSHYAQLALDEDVQQNNFAVMTGLGQVLLPAISVGCSGTIDAMSGAFPKLVVKLFELAVQGNIKEAQKLQVVLSRVEEIIVAHGPVGTKYAISRALGYGKTAEVCRAPLDQTLTAAQKNKFNPAIDAAIALEKSL
jgi:2-keto-3-deoxy-L-rhamnonate aldolase